MCADKYLNTYRLYTVCECLCVCLCVEGETERGSTGETQSGLKDLLSAKVNSYIVASESQRCIQQPVKHYS